MNHLGPINYPDLLVYSLFLLAHIVVVWILPYFPTQDGPSHVYNLIILHDLLNGGKEWGQYFSYDLKLTPNLGFNLLSYPLLFLVEPITAEKIFLSFYIILMGLSVLILISTFSTPFYYSRTIKYLSVPIIFNYTLMMGFYSYVIAVPVFLLAISMAWISRNRRWPWRFFCYNTAGALIYCLHLIPFVFYLIALAIFAVVQSKNICNATISLAKQVVGIFPLVAMLLFYLLSNSSTPVPSDFSYLLSSPRAQHLLANLFSFTIASFSPWQLLSVPALLFALILLLHEGWKASTNSKGEMCAEQKAMLLLISTLSLIYLLAPYAFGGGDYFNHRLPWVIFLLLLPLLARHSVHTGRVVSVSIMSAALLSLCINVIVFKQQSDDVSTFIEGLDPGCSKGDFIMLYKTAHPEWPKVDVIINASSYYGILNGCVDVGNYETARSYFPVHFNQNLPSLFPLDRIVRNPSSLDFSKHPELVEVLGWELQPDVMEKLQDFYALSFANEKLSLWRRR